MGGHMNYRADWLRCYGRFPSGSSRLQSFHSSLCSNGQAKPRTLRRTIFLHWASTARCTFQTGYTGTFSRSTRISTRLQSWQESFRQFFIRISSTSTTPSMPAALGSKDKLLMWCQGLAREKVQSPCVVCHRGLTVRLRYPRCYFQIRPVLYLGTRRRSSALFQAADLALGTRIRNLETFKSSMLMLNVKSCQTFKHSSNCSSLTCS